MIAKNRIFQSLLEGKAVKPANEYENKCVKQFTRYILYDRFGWTPYDIAALPADEYEDIILIITKENALKKIESDKAARAQKRR